MYLGMANSQRGMAHRVHKWMVNVFGHNMEGKVCWNFEKLKLQAEELDSTFLGSSIKHPRICEQSN